MKFKNLLLMSLLTAFVAACSVPQGDFCLSASYIGMKDATVDYVITNDIDLARSILSHNLMGIDSCGWEP